MLDAVPEGALSLPLIAAWHRLLRASMSWRSREFFDESLVTEAEKAIDRCGYHGEAIDLLISRFEIEFEAGRIDDARRTIARLEERARGKGVPSLSCELTYLHGLLRLDGTGPEERATFLKKARAAARSRKKLRLARRCEALLERRSISVT